MGSSYSPGSHKPTCHLDCYVLQDLLLLLELLHTNELFVEGRILVAHNPGTSSEVNLGGSALGYPDLNNSLLPWVPYINLQVHRPFYVEYYLIDLACIPPKVLLSWMD